MNGQNVKLIKLCEKYYLLSQAGMMKFPSKMADEIKKEYLQYFKKLKNDIENNKYAQWSKTIDININFDDLPISYKPNELERLAKNFFKRDYVSVEFNCSIDEKNVTFGRSFTSDDPKKPMIIHTKIMRNNIELSNYEGTIEHELIHFIQMLIAIYIKENGNETNENFVGYPFKKSIKDFDDYYQSEDVQKILTRKRKKHKSEINKKDFKQELYLIDPMEFYPQLTSAKHRLLMMSNITKGVFKRFVGMSSIPGDFFFENLKKHSKKLWNKAIKEFWKEIEPLIN